MLDWLIGWLEWLFDIWKDLPKEKKREIIERIIAYFEDLLRLFFRWCSDGGEN